MPAAHTEVVLSSQFLFRRVDYSIVPTPPPLVLDAVDSSQSECRLLTLIISGLQIVNDQRGTCCLAEPSISGGDSVLPITFCYALSRTNVIFMITLYAEILPFSSSTSCSLTQALRMP